MVRMHERLAPDLHGFLHTPSRAPLPSFICTDSIRMPLSVRSLSKRSFSRNGSPKTLTPKHSTCFDGLEFTDLKAQAGEPGKYLPPGSPLPSPRASKKGGLSPRPSFKSSGVFNEWGTGLPSSSALSNHLEPNSSERGPDSWSVAAMQARRVEPQRSGPLPELQPEQMPPPQPTPRLSSAKLPPLQQPQTMQLLDLAQQQQLPLPPAQLFGVGPQQQSRPGSQQQEQQQQPLPRPGSQQQEPGHPQLAVPLQQLPRPASQQQEQQGQGQATQAEEPPKRLHEGLNEKAEDLQRESHEGGVKPPSFKAMIGS